MQTKETTTSATYFNFFRLSEKLVRLKSIQKYFVLILFCENYITKQNLGKLAEDSYGYKFMAKRALIK